MSEYRYSLGHSDWTDETQTELRHWDEDIAPLSALDREVTPTNDAEAWDAFLAMLVRFGAVPCWDVLVDERARFARTGKARLNGVSVQRVEEEAESEPEPEPTQCQWFALCDRVATELVTHPVLGDVPACSRCAERYWSMGDVENRTRTPRHG